MSDHVETSESSPARFLNVVVGVIFVAIAAATVWYFAAAPRVPDVSEESFRNTVTEIDVARLEKERREKYGDPDLSAADSEIEILRDETVAANLMQFDMKGAKAIHDARVSTNLAANEVITKVDMAGFMAAGRPAFEGCRKGFDKLLKALRDGEIKPAQARQDPGADFSDYRENCGKAYPALVDHGLVQGGEWVDPDVGPYIFDILNRLRWAGVVDLRQRPSEQITPYELEIFTRWRSGSGALPASRRVQLVERAAQVSDDIPAHEIIGNIYFEAGQIDAAAEAYEKACKAHRDDAYLQKKCTWLSSRAARAGAPES